MFVVYLWDICFGVGSFYFASVIVFYCLNIFRSNAVTLGNGHNYTYRCSLSGYTEGSQFSKCCAISAAFLRFACLQIFPLLLYWAHWKSTSNFPFCFCFTENIEASKQRSQQTTAVTTNDFPSVSTWFDVGWKRWSPNTQRTVFFPVIEREKNPTNLM